MAKRISGKNGKYYRLKNKKLIDLTPSPTITAPASCDAVTSGFGSIPSQNQVTLSWGSSGAVSYAVRYRIVNTSNWTTVTSTSVNVTITGLSAGTIYQWQVQSVCSDVSLVSAWSATQTFSTTQIATGSITAGFTRNAKTGDYIHPDLFPNYGQLTEGAIGQYTTWKSAKMFCDSPSQPIWEKVNYDTGTGSADWIKWRSKSTNCASGPWFSRSQFYTDKCECSTINDTYTPSDELFYDVTYWFPDTQLEDPGEPDWVSNTGMKISPGFTGITGVGNTGGNPQSDGKHEGIWHTYGLLNSKKDRRNSVHASTTFSITKFELAWSVYEADTRTAGNKYQQPYFFCTNGGTTRKVFDKGIEYRFRGYSRLNTPGVLDGIYYHEVSEDGATFEKLLEVIDANQRGNFSTPYGRSGGILFRGGDSKSWLVGENSSYPTTVHDTFVFLKHYFLGTYPGMTQAPTVNALKDSHTFSLIPDDTLNGETINSVVWEIKDASNNTTLYSGSGNRDDISSTGNFWHGRWNWPIIDLQPAFVSTGGDPVRVCKTIVTTGGTSTPYCVDYEFGNYDDGTVVTVCSPPSGMSSVTSITEAILSWQPVVSASSYKVEYREQGTTTYSSITTSNNSISITGLTPSTSYEWRVTTVCGSVNSNVSNNNIFITGQQNICDVPVGLSISNLTDTTVSLNWSNTGAANYNIGYRLAGTSSWITVNSANNSISLTNLTPGTNYEWRVRSDCGTSISGYSNLSTFTTNSGITIPGTFSVLMIVDDAANPESADESLKDILVSNGNYSVDYGTDNNVNVDQAENYDLVIFAPSSSSHGSSLRWAKVNMLFATHEDMNSMWVANQSTSGGGNGSNINITDNTHPITSQFALGNLKIFNSSHAQASHSQNAASFKQLATNLNNGNTAIAVMDAGGARYEWWSLGRIVSLPFSEGGAADLSANGKELFVNACNWAASYDTSLSPNIAPHGVIAYDMDNGKFNTIVSRSLENETGTYAYFRYNDSLSSGSSELEELVISDKPNHIFEIGVGDIFNVGVSRSFNNNEFKIIIFDDSSGYNHNHGDEAENLMNDIIEELQINSNIVFSVTRDNNIVKSDELLNYDVLVLASSTGYTHFDSDDRTRIENFVNNGKSILSFHASSDAFWHSTANGGNTGVWDYYAENITGVSIQRNPNHTNNNTTGTLSTSGTITNVIEEDNLIHAMLIKELPSSWSHDEEYFYWENGYLDSDVSRNWIDIVDVSSTGSGSQNNPRMMVRFRNHPSGGLMWYTALGHNSSTWNSDTNFRLMAKNAVTTAFVKQRFTIQTELQEGTLTSNNPSDDTGIGTTYYVAATAVGLGDGSSEANAMDFATAKSQWNAAASNNTYLFKRGDIFYYDNSNEFTITSGGTGSGNELTFGAYGTGPKPKFSGAERDGSEFNGLVNNLNIWNILANIIGPQYLTLSDPVWGKTLITSNPVMMIRNGNEIVPKARSKKRYADGGSGTQLIDNNLSNELPNVQTFLNEDATKYTVHWKADLYTWEWDTVDASYVNNSSTLPFASGNHTTGVSTSFPYYLEATNPDLFLDGDVSVMRWAEISNQPVFYVPNGVDPANFDLLAIKGYTGISIEASNVIIKNLDLDGWYREAIYIDGASRTNISIENTIMRNCFGAGVYNDFNGEFSLDNCLLNNISGVGVYVNSSQDCSISNSTLNDIGLDGGQIYGVRNIPGKAQNQFHSGITGFGKTTGGMENLVVDKNKVFNIGYNGIRFDGNNNTVSDNYVCAAMLELSDGGGIYSYGGNATAYTTNCSVTGNTVVYCPGNLSDTNKNLDRNLAEGIYLDNGNDGTVVSNNVIVYAGGWAALNNFDNLDCTWDNNVFFGSSRFGLLTFDQTTSGNNDDNNVTNNYFVVWHPDHSPVISLKRNSPKGYTPVDTSNSNKYIMLYKQRPAHENVIGKSTTYTEWVGYGARYFETLSEWNNSSGFDGSSTEQLYQKDFTTIDQAYADTFLAVNAGTTSKTVTLPSGTWKDVSGTIAGATTSVAGNSSKLFMKI